MMSGRTLKEMKETDEDEENILADLCHAIRSAKHLGYGIGHSLLVAGEAVSPVSNGLLLGCVHWG